MGQRRQRLANARKVAGFSQERLAEAIGVERTTVMRWEQGRTCPQPWARPQLARALGLADAALSELLFAGADDLGITTSVAGPTVEEVEALLRRDFMGAVAGLALSLPTSTKPTVGRQLGRQDTAQLLERTARLRRLDDVLGGADTYRLYATQLAATTALANDASCGSSTGRALMAVVAEQAQLAGWAAFDAGMQREARQHYETSLTAAQEAQHAALAGNAFAFLAYQTVSTTEPDVDTALTSYETAERDASPRVRTLLLDRLAWTYAVAGRAHDTERALARAQEALHASDGRPEPDWVFWVDDTELQIMAGRCWTELHRPLRAVPLLEDVLARYEDIHARDKALYLTWLATAYLDAGEPEQAAAVTGRAVDLAAGVGSVRPAARMATVLHRLQPYQAMPSVADLLERVRN
jgi:DNA-binding XRE family transcriptional regulator